MIFRKVILSLALVLTGLATASAQLVVETRPEVPQNRRQVKAPNDDSFVLLPAEWEVKDGTYYYVQPRYTKKRSGMKFVPGKWKKVAGGWVWRPGYWK